MRFKFFICTKLLVFGFICNPYDNRLKVINKSNSNIYVVYHDTSTLSDYPNLVLNLDLVKIGDSISLITNRNGWPNHIKNSRNKRLNLFFIHQDTVKKRTKEFIILNEIYIKKVSYSLKEIENMNWQVIIDSFDNCYR